MAYALLTIFVAACVVGVVALAISIWNLVRIPLNLKPNVEAWASGNPFNYLFKPQALSATGLVARRRVGQALLVFIAAWAVGVAAGLLAKWAA
jgi:hypothetical protein